MAFPGLNYGARPPNTDRRERRRRLATPMADGSPLQKSAYAAILSPRWRGPTQRAVDDRSSAVCDAPLGAIESRSSRRAQVASGGAGHIRCAIDRAAKSSNWTPALDLGLY